jgi:hypothetical protein
MIRNWGDWTMMPTRILILGASYGSLLATKLLLAGHNVHLVCLAAEADKINADGLRVRMPVKGRDGLVEVHSSALPGTVSASTPDGVDPARYDLVCLAMQEPQYRLPGVRELLDRVGRSGVPCMSIMNMPPLPYLARIPGLDAASLRDCYTDATVWATFEPGRMTLCSPDPQAFRPPGEPVNVLQVSLPTNFKAAQLADPRHTAMLEGLQNGIETARYRHEGVELDLPVKLKVHRSLFVPLAKWAMLLTGNYRCVEPGAPRAIRDAVHSDLELSRAIYGWVTDLCVSLGAEAEDMVPFEKYAAAARGLAAPSSAARALHAGAPYIERVDKLVQRIAWQKGVATGLIDAQVALVDAKLDANRRAAA